MSTVPITTAPRSVGDAMAAGLRETSLLVVACGVAGALAGGIGSMLVRRPITLEGTVGPLLFAGVGSAILGAGAFTLLRPWLPSGTGRPRPRVRRAPARTLRGLGRRPGERGPRPPREPVSMSS